MTLQQLHYAIVIAETKSINKAAEILYISQPSLTSAIQELENSLGIVIFNRSRRGVTLTNDGKEFILYAKQVYGLYEQLEMKYSKDAERKEKFSISTQHYSFAVKAFVEMVKQYDTTKYEFALIETKTLNVIRDVVNEKSQIGILYLSEFNRSVMKKTFTSNRLVFTPLIECSAYVYLHKDHPLAGKSSIRFDELEPYPCLVFDQGDNGSFYYSEEILSSYEYPRLIHVNDRATSLNLMVGLNGYTLCSGIISEELNGSDYVVVPFAEDPEHPNSVMQVGYITKKDTIPGPLLEQYIEALKETLKPMET